MSLNAILPELSKLSLEEKAQVIQILQDELDQHRQPQGAVNEVWSPQITPEAARQLQKMLEEDKQKHD